MFFTTQRDLIRKASKTFKQIAPVSGETWMCPAGRIRIRTPLTARQVPEGRRAWIAGRESPPVRRSLARRDGVARPSDLKTTYLRTYDGTNVALWPELEALHGVGSVRRCGAYRIRRIENPARCLDADRIAALHRMCTRAASLSFGMDHSTYWASRPAYFNEISEWWVAEWKRDLAGWHAIAVWEGDCGTVLDHDTLVLLPAHRRTGLGRSSSTKRGYAWRRGRALCRSAPAARRTRWCFGCSIGS